MNIVLYLHAHQPLRLRNYTIFDAGSHHDYFADHHRNRANNRQIIDKVSTKCYLPTNKLLMSLLKKHPEFCLSLSVSGTLLEQLETWRPDVLASFAALVATGRVEIVGETYHHTLAFFYDRSEFDIQVDQHAQTVERLFNYRPQSFRGTELSYNNQLGKWAEERGYKAILSEGWDPILKWRSPNYIYRPVGTERIRLLTKNYRLSDDIAFRFGDRSWSGWPLTADKFTHWIHSSDAEAEVINLFMDYETFGEHQWHESGIFGFLSHLPEKWLAQPGSGFMGVSEAATSFSPRDSLDMPEIVSWADVERDLSAWNGNAMQQEALKAIYGLKSAVLSSADDNLIRDWRLLQTSDHFYYMCTKWWNDGDIHAYFNAYASPYEAQMSYMNAILDLRARSRGTQDA